jgi:hypothetical protein
MYQKYIYAPSSKSKADIKWIRLRFVAICIEKTFRIECHRVWIDMRVMKNIPDHNQRRDNQDKEMLTRC